MRVIPSEENMRLQRWLQQHYPRLAYSVLQKCLRQGRVLVNGVPTYRNVLLQVDQDIHLVDKEIQQEKDATSAIRLSSNPEYLETLVHQLRALICYEDDRCFVLNKPAGLAVQGGSKIRHSVDALLKATFVVTKEHLLLVHRLDKMTSGLLLVAKGRANAEHFASLFKDRCVQKTYMAITYGIPSPQEGQISAPLLKRRIGGEERVVVDYEKGQSAETVYSVRTAYGSYALLELRPLTGRTHQLRVHCASVLQTPIVGDGKYGNAHPGLQKERVDMLLHAYQLYTPELPVLTAPLPEQFLAFAKDKGLKDTIN